MLIPGPDPDRSLRLSVHFHSDGLINPVPAFFFLASFFNKKILSNIPIFKIIRQKSKLKIKIKSPCFLQIDQASSQDIKGF